MSTKFTVQPTDDRLNVQGLFVAQLNPTDINGKFRAGKDILVINSTEGFTFRIKARLQAYAEVEAGTIRLDQKIRMAIGVDAEGEVTITPPTGILEIRRPLSEQFFGKQVNLLRVRKATFTDMEINVCRLPSGVMKSIGVEEGDKIIVEAANKRIEIRALELTTDMIASRIKKENDEDSKYYSVKDKRRVVLIRHNILDYDLPWILLDRDARIKLGIKAYDPVMVYRSNSYAIKTKLHTITLPMVAGIVGFVIGLDYLLPNVETTTLLVIKAMLFVGGLLLTIWLNLLSIRKKLK